MKKKIEYERICNKCGSELYPDVKIEGAITVSMGKCPRCSKKDMVLTPTRDYETENKGLGWD